MSGFMAIAVNAGLLAPMGVSFADMVTQSKNNKLAHTNIEIVAGHGVADAGGSLPDISVWNDDGARLGQWQAKGRKLVPGGSSADKPDTSITILESQGVDDTPSYVLLTMASDDAICITQINVSGHDFTPTWMGDVAQHCGADWYQSNRPTGSDHYMPKCMWLDKNHSDGLRYVGMSLHMGDFNTDPGVLAEYNAHKENLCESMPRFNRIKDFESGVDADNAIPPFFSPPLKYNTTDQTDVDFAALFKNGRFQDKRDNNRRGLGMTTNGSVDKPGHVIISDWKQHSAVELCESDSSRGPSFAATEEGRYCDMSTKIHHPLCSATVTGNCFNVDTKQRLGPAPSARQHARDLDAAQPVHKQYYTSARWGP